MGHLEALVKEDTERAAKSLKENLSEKLMEVQSSLEHIAENTSKQVQLIDEKIAANDANDAERELHAQKDSKEMRSHISQAFRQIHFLAEHIGADPMAIEEATAPTSPGASSPRPLTGSTAGDRGLQSAGVPKSAGGAGAFRGGVGAMDQRLDIIERRLDALDGGHQDPFDAASDPSSPVA